MATLVHFTKYLWKKNKNQPHRNSSRETRIRENTTWSGQHNLDSKLDKTLWERQITGQSHSLHGCKNPKQNISKRNLEHKVKHLFIPRLVLTLESWLMKLITWTEYKGKNMIILIDLEIAFDKNSTSIHDFKHTFRKLKREEKFLNLIKITYLKNTRENTILNDEMLKAFPLSAGAERGCASLLPPLNAVLQALARKVDIKVIRGTSLVVQCLRLHDPTAGNTDLMPGQETKVLHAAQHGHKKIVIRTGKEEVRLL